MLPESSEIESFRRWLLRKFPHTSTPVHYTNDVALFFEWAAQPLREIGVRDVDAYIEHCQTAGHRVTTINRRLAALRTFFRWLTFELDTDLPNPVIPARHFIRPGERLPRDARDADLEQLFAAVGDPRDRAMFILMLRCGLRVGEVRNLSLGDLALQPAPGLLPRLRVCGKGNRERTVYLSAQALAALHAWLSARPAGNDAPDAPLFLNRFGDRLTVTGIQYRLGRACQNAGVWLTCHQFRHTFGRHLTEARVPVTSIQRLLGHRWLRSTEVYLHLSDPCVQADYAAAMRMIARRLPGLDAAPEHTLDASGGAA